MSLLLPRASVRPQVRLLSSAASLYSSTSLDSFARVCAARGGFWVAALPRLRRAPPTRHPQLVVPRAAQEAEGRPERNLFDGLDRALRSLQLQRGNASASTPQSASWTTRMRNGLARYRAAEAQLAAAFAMTERERNRGAVGFEPLRKQVDTALHVVRNMCDPGRVPQDIVARLTQAALWEPLQKAMAWRQRELHQPLRLSLPEPPQRTYAECFDHLKQRLRALTFATRLDPTVQAWAKSLYGTVLEDYLIIETSCIARARRDEEDKSAGRYKEQVNKLPAWRDDYLQELDQALAAPWNAAGEWSPGFADLARAPRLCALVKACRFALSLRVAELQPHWADDLS